MNPLIQLKTITRPLVTLALLWLSFGLLPRVHAVVPPPDGGYPGQNTAEGQGALLHLAGGTYNTALGWASLGFNVTGNYNTGVGAATLLFNTANENTAVGAGALLNNTTGLRNTATGTFAQSGNTTGSDNTANGDKALFNNTEGNGNTAIGTFALRTNTLASGNTAVGFGALLSSNANSNTAVGFDALLSNTIGGANTAMGWHALVDNNTGVRNTALGHTALANNTTGIDNTAVGFAALAGATGNLNIALGVTAGDDVSTGNDIICIGARGANVSESCYIGNIWSQPGGSQAVYVNELGKLGALVSSLRFKEEIKPIEEISKVIYRLKPVSFHYKPEIEPKRPLGFGLIAEDVEKVSPDLITRDEQGKPQTVRYEAVNAMLLNEFLKEHRKNEEQQATIAQLQKQIEALTAGLQKVSDQIEVMKPAPQMALNNR